MDHQQHYYPLYFPEHFPREAHSQYASQRREMETQDLELRRFSLSPWEVYPQDSRDAYDLDPNNFELEYNNLINDFSESEDVQSEDFPDTMHCDRVQVQGQPEATSQPFDIDAPPSMTQGSLSSIESDATTLESFEDADTVMNEPQDEIPSKNADVVMVMDIQRQPELQYTAQHIRALVQKTVAHMQEEQELAEVEVFVRSVEALHNVTTPLKHLDLPANESSTSLQFMGAGIDGSDLNEVAYSITTEFREQDWDEIQEAAQTSPVFSSLLVDPVDATDTIMEGATKEPRQFQFPLVGRDEEEMEERRRILGINTSAEAPAIAPTGKGLTTIPVEGPEFPEANTAHAIDTAPLIFSPFHAFQDEDIISLMEASSSSLSGRGRSPSPEFPNFDWDSLFASAQPDVSVPIAGCSATKSSEMHLSAQGITRKYDATAVVVNLETPHAGSPHQVSRHLEVATVERVKIGRGRRKTSPAKTGQQKTAQSTVHQGKGKTGNGNKPFICTLPECPKDFASARKTDLLRHLREYHEMFLFVCVNPHCRSLGYDNQKKKHRTARALRAKGHVVHCYEGAIEADNWLTVVERIKGKGFKLLPLVPVEYREAILNGFSGDND